MSDNKNNPYERSVDNLSEGLLQNIQPSLERIEKQLKELNAKQDAIVTQIHDENLTLAQTQFSPELQDMFRTMAAYHNKLLSIKKDMKQLHDRGNRLKKRAANIKEVKEKALMAKIQKDIELKREQELIGKGSGSVSSLKMDHSSSMHQNKQSPT
ncbi:unnamed protein product [Acanthoscelides obtectus]|uniref:Biogenesis of lysosome-related organelles complex 1 subunit 6 n=1 Tax=Acanthoscelides obtectus TaxID=200917 RepID=A0A9P0Q641_ACAOB|nr:unnamed protein product [Acanthoscelides obtectus]CAK1626959.1 Biogenesis of lysosome-related organelles complex 1 subunit 6 [Acanthoscelides obtectus]